MLTQFDVLKAIGRSGKPAAGRGSADLDPLEKAPPLVDSDNLKPFVSNELQASKKPVKFRLPTFPRRILQGNVQAQGVEMEQGVSQTPAKAPPMVD